jgi:hypothetical protein
MNNSNSPSHKLDLSRDQRALVVLLQLIRYGRIERLLVRDGEPVMSGVRWKKTVKLGSENAAHPYLDAKDFALRGEVVEFLRLLHQFWDAELTDIEVRNGLPFIFAVCGTTSN